LQRNVLDRRRWDNRNELRIAMVTWIERTYHRRRHQAALGRLTPIEYEIINTPPKASGDLRRVLSAETGSDDAGPDWMDNLEDH